jgi:hypothetical protein
VWQLWHTLTMVFYVSQTLAGKGHWAQRGTAFRSAIFVPDTLCWQLFSELSSRWVKGGKLQFVTETADKQKPQSGYRVFGKFLTLVTEEVVLFLWSDFVLKWSEVCYGEVLDDKSTMYIRVTLCWGYLIVLWLFHLVCIFYWGCFNLFCNVWMSVCGGVLTIVWVFW